DSPGHAFGGQRRWQSQRGRDDLAVRDRRNRVREVRRERTTGRVIHLQGADETLAIARHDAPCRFRIDAPQQSVEPFGSTGVGDSMQSMAKLLIGAWTGK